MAEVSYTFTISGYPTLYLYEEHLEIKPVKHLPIKTYYYHEIKRVAHQNPAMNFFRLLMVGPSLIRRLFFKKENWHFNIYKKSGEKWTYETVPEKDEYLDKLISLLNERLH